MTRVYYIEGLHELHALPRAVAIHVLAIEFIFEEVTLFTSLSCSVLSSDAVATAQMYITAAPFSEISIFIPSRLWPFLGKR